MATGRTVTTMNRSERFLGSYGYGHGHGHGQESSVTESEFAEEDVWSTIDDDRSTWRQRAAVEEDSQGGGVRTNWGHRRVGGLTLAFEDSVSSQSRIMQQLNDGDTVASHEASASASFHHIASSAPMDVPDWSKILRVNSIESIHDSDDGIDDRDHEVVPPHEYLAREYERRRKMSGMSVIEGVGRTLKGRDLRRVRDAVWSQTGFYG